MKNYGSILDFTSQRNADIMRAYHAQLQKAKYILMPDIFEKIAESPASRFWVSEERAAAVINAMLTNKPLIRMRSNKKEMFDEIFRRFLERRRQYPDMPVLDLVSMIVNEPAPKFYLTPRTVGEYLYRIKNGNYEQHNRPNPSRER